MRGEARGLAVRVGRKRIAHDIDPTNSASAPSPNPSTTAAAASTSWRCWRTIERTNRGRNRP
jgi:hypothetical protein